MLFQAKLLLDFDNCIAGGFLLFLGGGVGDDYFQLIFLILP